MRKIIYLGLVAVLLLSACGSSEWQTERELGEEAVKEKDYQTAVEHYEKAVELMPKHQALKEELEYAVSERNKQLAKQEKERAEKEQKARDDDKSRQQEIENFMNRFDDSTIEGFLRVAMLSVLNDGYLQPEEISQDVIIGEPLSWEIQAIGRGKDGLSETQILEGYFEDITRILKAFKEKGFTDYGGVMVILNSDFGTSLENKEEDWAIKIGLNEDTLELIDFDTFNYLELPNVADAYLLHPALNPEFK